MWTESADELQRSRPPRSVGVTRSKLSRTCCAGSEPVVHASTPAMATAERIARRSRTSGALVLVVPHHRLPELDLVSVGVHDPRELAVLVRFGSADDAHAGGTELREHLDEIVDPVVDHEGR